MKIVEKFPGRWYQNNIRGYNISDVYDFFPIGMLGTETYQSEDFGFASLCKAVGVEMFIYGNATLSHVGMKAYSANLHEATTIALRRESEQAYEAT